MSDVFILRHMIGLAAAAPDVDQHKYTEAHEALDRLERERDDYRMAAEAEAQLANQYRAERDSARDALRALMASIDATLGLLDRPA